MSGLACFRPIRDDTLRSVLVFSWNVSYDGALLARSCVESLETSEKYKYNTKMYNCMTSLAVDIS